MYQTVRNRSLTLVTNRQTHCETTELTDLEDLTEEERIIRSERDARLWTAIDHLPTERQKDLSAFPNVTALLIRKLPPSWVFL